MKKFEEVRLGILTDYHQVIDDQKKLLENPSLNERQKNSCRWKITESQHRIENIDEVTLINIGDNVNNLIETIKKGFQENLRMYYFQFDAFMEKCCLGNDDEKVSHYPSRYSYAKKLGITKEDLQCLKATHPFKGDFGDELRQRVNFVMGTKIPTVKEMNKIEKQYNNIDAITDEKTADQVYVDYQEMCRDAGLLKNDLGYFLLADNVQYQEAKSRLLENSKKRTRSR